MSQRKILEYRKLAPSAIRELCIEHDWYDAGNNDDYNNLLRWVGTLESVTLFDLYAIALNIKNHSSEQDMDLGRICTEIANVCYTWIYIDEDAKPFTIKKELPTLER